MLFAAAFDADATERYSRHLLMPEIGCEGQKTLMDTSVLVVGAGGLGSPVLLYLAAAGIGTFGIVDYDTVDLSNLQRQIIHSEQSVGKSKCESARSAILGLNSRLNVKVYDNMFTTENALDIVRDYDIVVDATDNAPTRYLISDCCVILGKPLVSASALRTEGQLTVYNFEGGPCYRCIFPNPPLAASVTNCSDGGVLGAVVGVLGSLQAMEVVKVAMKLKCPDRFRNVEVMAGRMLMYSGFHCSFRNFKLRAKKSDCAACGIKPTITASSMPNYEAFCGSAACDKSTSLKILQRDERITCEEYHDILRSEKEHILIDVREKHQFDICSLKNSLNIPLEVLEENIENIDSEKDIFVMCRRGNRSQKAVDILKKHGITSKDIIGGLSYWSNYVDKKLPKY